MHPFAILFLWALTLGLALHVAHAAPRPSESRLARAAGTLFITSPMLHAIAADGEQFAATSVLLAAAALVISFGLMISAIRLGHASSGAGARRWHYGALAAASLPYLTLAIWPA